MVSWICLSNNLDKALWLAGEVEALCHMYWAAIVAGNPVVLADDKMVSVLKRFKTYGRQPDALKAEDVSAHAVFAPTRRDVKKKATKSK